MSRILKKIFRYLGLLLLIISPLFLVHFFLFNRFQLVLTYGANVLLAIIFYAILVWKEKQLMPYLGYYFLYFSIFKFFVFLVLIRPILNLSEGVRGPDFLFFFVPYTVCTAFEIGYLIKELNKG
ncbi:MAG: hypothetical protein RIT43_723 [Bacteroidota bacterium]|jgi:hypothetical protein